MSASEQALRDYEDYLFYYGLKEYCTQYSEYVDSAEDRHFVQRSSELELTSLFRARHLLMTGDTPEAYLVAISELLCDSM